MAVPDGSDDKQSSCNAEDLSLFPGLGRFPVRREKLPTSVFFPGEFHGQRSLAGYSLWGHKVLDTTEQKTVSIHTYVFSFYLADPSYKEVKRYSCGI